MSIYQGFFIFAFILLALGVILVVVNNLLALRRPYKEKLIAYECGLDPSGDTRIPFRIRFYLIGLLFLVFDVEIVFLYPWAIVFDHLGLFGFIEIFVFMIMLLVAYIYAWSEGALTWE
ncbi:NADH-quinone oxidoreductase subunit A [Thermodesulfobacterium hydrogeniphilum]|uniref:NADH-quinone oxidoreductase subunit A n=1 Tax=Thermodesulfobacterium hydrogeniphilum TaxID=161156 RepID=UPI0005717769|nr:NADH-quinone oxidoreductase subunit A [Thermodesulfobacterium hydrogeniphilum]